MQTMDQDRVRELNFAVGPTPIITREEYHALMSGLATSESELEHLPRLLQAEAQVKRLEFILMILAGLLLIVFMLCRVN